IARAISGNLRVRLTGQERTRLANSSTTNPEAYQLYLKGRYHANQGTAAALKKAIEYFQKAIKEDANYALAYSGLADAYIGLGGALIFEAPSETLPKAKIAAMKAVELDDSLAEAHASLGEIEWAYEWEWASAERELKRAIELNANSALSHTHYALALVSRGRFDESIAEAKRAQQLDPLLFNELPYVYLVAGRYDDAIAEYHKQLELYPDMAWKHAELGWAYAMKGMYAQAVGEYDKISTSYKRVTPENQLVASGLGWVYAISGRRADGLEIAKEFKDLSFRTYVDAYGFAAIYAGLGDKDEAFRLLGKAYEQHSSSIQFLAVDPFWYGMRSDLRYADLLRRLGLPQQASQ